MNDTCPYCSFNFNSYDTKSLIYTCVKCRKKWKIHDELYCLSCQYPQKPMVIINDSKGTIICGNCDNKNQTLFSRYKILEYKN